MLSLFLTAISTLTTQPPAPTVLAQSENPCQNTDTVLPADEMRQLRLDDFGVSIMIPENYRAILRNDGSVEVVDQGTYNLIRCEAIGGDPLGRGYSSLMIRSVSAPTDESLEAIVREDVYSEVPESVPARSNQCISPYPFEDRQGYLVQTPTQRHAEFWVEPAIGPDITVIETSCDCTGMVDRLIDVLGRTDLMSAADSEES